MISPILEMDHVYKRFRRGEMHDSLRDLLPALYGRMLKGANNGRLTDNEFWALQDVSFRVNEGEALGIIGSNGAGKSTILKLLTGIMKPTEGDVRVHGTLSALIEVGAGFHPDLTGRDNIFLNGVILGMKKEQIRRKFDEIVDFSGLADFIDTPVKRYSSGMYARLGFAVAAHVEPRILVVDEVLSVGDYAFQNKCVDKMKSIIKDGLTVIFVSHNLRAVMELCSRCILLDHGKILKEGSPNEVVRHYLNRDGNNNGERASHDVFISNVFFRGENGDATYFESGQRAVLEAEITAKADFKNLSVSIALFDDNDYEIFNTSTQRLHGTTLSFKQGEKRKVSFHLDLHLARGTYHVGVYLYRYDIQQKYDTRLRAATFYLGSAKDVRGVVNLYPNVLID